MNNLGSTYKLSWEQEEMWFQLLYSGWKIIVDYEAEFDLEPLLI